MCALSAGSRGPSTLRAILRRSRCPRRLGTGAGASASTGAAARGGGRNDLSASVADPETKPTDRQGGGSPVVHGDRAQARLLRLAPEGTVGLPGTALLPHLARRPGALQAGRPGRGLGGPAAAPHHGRLHRGVQPGARASRAPIPSVPYAVFSFTGLLPWQFFAGALCALRRQSGRQRQPAHQGLLPPPGHPHLGRAWPAWSISPSRSWSCSASWPPTASPPPGTSSSCRSSSCWRSPPRWPSASG